MEKKIGETSYKETAFGIIPRSKLIPLEIEGIKRAWDFVMESFLKGEINITLSFIQKLHEVGFKWIFPKYGGKFRRIEVVVSSHTPPKSYLIPQLMTEFIKDLKTRLKYLPNIDDKNFIEELISLLTWSHHKFLWIHPFQDYNGRIGRLLNNIILINLNLPPIELKVETTLGRKKYIKAMQDADNGNFDELEKIIRNAFEESIREIENQK
jgi:Fic family protein